jgi:hypothetical protein
MVIEVVTEPPRGGGLSIMINTHKYLAVDAYSIMELFMPTWLIHDYGDGGVVDVLVMDAYSEVEVCTSIFLGEASN